MKDVGYDNITSQKSLCFQKIHFWKNRWIHPVFSGLIMRYFEAMKINYGLHNTVLDNLDNFGNSE